jgi:hypothetical protein
MTDAAKDFATMHAFIVGGLTDIERRAFEDRLAREPELAQELEQSLRMREGLLRLRSTGYFQNVATPRKQTRILGLALAASVILAMFLWVSRPGSSPPLFTGSLPSGAAGGLSTVAAQFTFVSMRGGSVPDLDLPPTGFVEFRVAASNDAGQYGLTLQRVDDGAPPLTVARIAGLRVASDGYLHVYADASRLSSGRYQLNVQATTDPRTAADAFDFNLRSRSGHPAP